jgi:hypothetical protein
MQTCYTPLAANLMHVFKGYRPIGVPVFSLIRVPEPS